MSAARRSADAPSSGAGETGAVTRGAVAPPSEASTKAAPRGGFSGALRHAGSRLVYWTPVFGALALFAQVSFLGLRPALSEARRLADASDMLEARWTHDRGLYDAYELQVRVRQDPIFRERQRRLRCSVFERASSGT
jgi:hypothetical protein